MRRIICCLSLTGALLVAGGSAALPESIEETREGATRDFDEATRRRFKPPQPKPQPRPAPPPAGDPGVVDLGGKKDPVVLVPAMPAPWGPVLKAAHGLEARKFGSFVYGTRGAKHREICCTEFVAAAVEEITGKPLGAKANAAINIAGVAEDEQDDLVEQNDDQTRGVQYALVDMLKIAEKVKPADAQPGDFLQVWWKREDGSWSGHAALVERVYKDERGRLRAKLYGAHKSQGGIGLTDDDNDVILSTHAKRKLYLARMTVAPAPPAGPIETPATP